MIYDVIYDGVKCSVGLIEISIIYIYLFFKFLFCVYKVDEIYY